MLAGCTSILGEARRRAARAALTVLYLPRLEAWAAWQPHAAAGGSSDSEGEGLAAMFAAPTAAAAAAAWGGPRTSLPAADVDAEPDLRGPGLEGGLANGVRFTAEATGAWAVAEQLMRSWPPRSPLLLLATTHVPLQLLPPQVAGLFGYSTANPPLPADLDDSSAHGTSAQCQTGADLDDTSAQCQTASDSAAEEGTTDAAIATGAASDRWAAASVAAQPRCGVVVVPRLMGAPAWAAAVGRAAAWAAAAAAQAAAEALQRRLPALGAPGPASAAGCMAGPRAPGSLIDSLAERRPRGAAAAAAGRQDPGSDPAAAAEVLNPEVRSGRGQGPATQAGSGGGSGTGGALLGPAPENALEVDRALLLQAQVCTSSFCIMCSVKTHNAGYKTPHSQ